MGKVVENKQLKEKNLLNTAFHLFTTKGIVKTSISDIVQQAGVAKGTFYLYFRDKYDIQEKLIVYKTGQTFRHALTSSHYQMYHDFTDQLIAIIDDVLNQFQKDPNLLRFINKNLSWGIFRRAINQSSDDYLTTIQDIMAGSGCQEPDIMLYTIIELVGATCHSVILEQDPVDLEHYKPHLYHAVRAIVKSFQTSKPEE